MKFETDKLLHFSFGGLICALVSFVVILQEPSINWTSLAFVLIGTVATFVISVLKEMIDDKFDWKDIIAAMIGCVPVYIAVLLGIVFHNAMLR